MAFIKTRKKIVSSAIVSSLSVMAGNAIAQDQVTQLDTIRAQAEAEQTLKVDKSANSKFVAPLLDTPKSVSIISKQLIADTQVTTLSDALRTVPGITLGAGEGGNPNGDRPFIRGYNSESSMYVDGVRSATSQNREMFAVEQVEVTKGSASAMGGAGTTGGSINMISKVAKKGDFLEGSVGAGTDNYQRITLDGNKDFGNGIAARVAVLGHKNEKAGQADGTEYARAGIAPSITFGLDTATRATLSYYYLKSDDTPDSGIPYNNPFSATNKPARISENGNGKPIDVKQGLYYGWKDRDFQKQENQIGTIKLEHDLTDNLTISNTAVYGNSKNDYLWTNPDDSRGNFYQPGGSLTGNVWARANSRVADTDTFTDQLALTGKFNTGPLKHSFNLGAEYSDQETDRTQYIIDGLNATGNAHNACTPADITSGWCTSVQNPNRGPWTGTLSTNGADRYNIESKSKSVYFLDSIEFNPQWILDLGVRWDDYSTEQTMTYGARNNSVTGANNTPITANAGDKVTIENDKDFINYQAGITFKPVENGSIYASYATSSNPVGVDGGDGSEGITAAINNLKPEEVRTMELGTKWDVLNDKLNLTAAIFRTEKTNTRATGDDGTTSNIGETRVDGIELGASGNITEKWAVSAGYTYLDSELVDGGYENIGTTAAPLYISNRSNGNQVQNVAKNSATLWTTYQVLPQLTLGAGAVAMDKVYGNATNTKFVPGYVRYDAMARYNVNKNVDLQLNVNNLSDERYFTKAYSSHYATEAEGRSAVLSLNFKY
ncbi:TonB-dependent receptor [Acinetobacter terrae]|jgi:catecholate siderophore receptor|uniref:TonB-dependent siderophore receptor n=1 Tax=Acinetobacter terrae TaxID=2731247 RepID=A0A4R0EI26_9GAMM|nr:TonB-dependent siderophore receptor [Acinetobacter terrae]NNH14461.1 TonB-dependent siderophore receptor [Acinetobacter terrae]OAL88255.1 ligand-gated channel protein [Acinetobacter terrae]TCB55970.1 TonB-dependent siderophore receptor [Acinetobacter terrae]